MKFKNVKDKWRFIEKLEQEDNVSIQKYLHVIQQLAKDKNIDVRRDLAERLGFFEGDKIEEILCQMLDDKNRYVRLEALDSLFAGRMEKTIDKVKTMLSGQYFLTRGYAVYTLFHLIVNCYGFNQGAITYYNQCIQSSLQKEENEWVKLDYYETQYWSGDESGLDFLIDQYKNVMDDKSHLYTWTFINLFEEMLGYRNKEKIHSILNYKKEQLLEQQQIKVENILMRPVLYKILIVDRDNSESAQLARIVSNKKGFEKIKIESAGVEEDIIWDLYTYDCVICIGIEEYEERFALCKSIYFLKENMDTSKELKKIYERVKECIK